MADKGSPLLQFFGQDDIVRRFHYGVGLFPLFQIFVVVALQVRAFLLKLNHVQQSTSIIMSEQN